MESPKVLSEKKVKITSVYFIVMCTKMSCCNSNIVFTYSNSYIVVMNVRQAYLLIQDHVTNPLVECKLIAMMAESKKGHNSVTVPWNSLRCHSGHLKLILYVKYHLEIPYSNGTTGPKTF